MQEQHMSMYATIYALLSGSPSTRKTGQRRQGCGGQGRRAGQAAEQGRQGKTGQGRAGQGSQGQDNGAG